MIFGILSSTFSLNEFTVSRSSEHRSTSHLLLRIWVSIAYFSCTQSFWPLITITFPFVVATARPSATLGQSKNRKFT